MVLNPLEFAAPPHVRQALSGLGRTEDLALSPEWNRLAIAEFSRNRILVLDVAREERLKTGALALTDFVELTSAQLHSPHGVSFLDEETVIVANRNGATLIFRVPPSGSPERHLLLSPMRTIRGGWLRPNVTPGSVAVSGIGPSLTEVLICNNYQDTVTRHLLDRRRNYREKGNQVLLRAGLSVPDGVAVSRDGLWIAISNHSTHSVLMFENTRATNLKTEPVGALLNVDCPHGLGFTQDGGTLFVASAAAPFVHIFAREATVDGSSQDDWRGNRRPVASVRVMDDETFSKGRWNDEEGGPKGLEVSTELNLVATTSEFQPLAFFELSTLLRTAALKRASVPASR